jgi:lysophospholipase L1-like esterase
MTAMNGFAGSPRRLVGLCCALVMAISAVAAVGASSAMAMKKTPTPTAYVALGDSISFGYKQETFIKNEEANAAACAKHEQAACEPPSSFEPGFVGDVGAKLAKSEKKAGNALSTIDLGCPGETSGGLIGNGPLGTGIEELRASKSEPTLDVSAPCGYENVDGFSLKAPLGGASELEVAVGLLEEGVDVKLVTIQIGSNDELASVAKCENPSYDAEQGFHNLIECIEVEASLSGHEYPGGLFTHILTNIGVVIGTLRNYGYDGPVVVLGFYNPQAELLSGSDALQAALNEHLEGAVNADEYGPGVAVAPIFGTFNPSDGATATKKDVKQETAAICKYTEECNAFDKEKTGEGDIHPTAKGYAKMAKAIEAALATL